MTKKCGATSLMAIYIFLTEKLIRAATGYVGSKSFVPANQTADKNIEAIFDDAKFVLINIYNCNTESQHLLTQTELHKILQNVGDIENMNVTRGVDFNFHFNSKLEAKGGKPTLKKKSIRKMIKLMGF